MTPKIKELDEISLDLRSSTGAFAAKMRRHVVRVVMIAPEADRKCSATRYGWAKEVGYSFVMIGRRAGLGKGEHLPVRIRRL
jgi:hypothetical protein